MAEGLDSPEEFGRIGGEILMEQDTSEGIGDAKEHGSGMEIDAAVD